MKPTTPPHIRTNTTWLLLSLTLLGAMLGSWAGAAPAEARPSVLLGAHVEPSGGRSFVGSVRAFEHRLGRNLAIVNKYHDWSMVNFSDERRLIRRHHLVMVSWHPTDGAGDPTRAEKVAYGRYDGLIRRAADGLKALHAPVLLRWDFEMTQSRGQTEYVGPPSAFIAAWRHMHRIFQARGATNVRWVWAPQTAGFHDGNAPRFYPGDRYVDWIEASCVFGGHSWPTFRKTFRPMYRWGARHAKPLMAWVGLPEKPSSPGWKARWFRSMRKTIAGSMPHIRSIVYFHASTDAGDFHADTTRRSWRAFKGIATAPLFRARPRI